MFTRLVSLSAQRSALRAVLRRTSRPVLSSVSVRGEQDYLYVSISDDRLYLESVLTINSMHKHYRGTCKVFYKLINDTPCVCVYV